MHLTHHICMKHLQESGSEVFIYAFRFDLQPHLKVKLPFSGSIKGQWSCIAYNSLNMHLTHHICVKHLQESGSKVFIYAFRFDLQPHLKVKLPFFGSIEGQWSFVAYNSLNMHLNHHICMKYFQESARGYEVFICAVRFKFQSHLKVKLPFSRLIKGQRLSMAPKKLVKVLNYASKPLYV